MKFTPRMEIFGNLLRHVQVEKGILCAGCQVGGNNENPDGNIKKTSIFLSNNAELSPKETHYFYLCEDCERILRKE